VKGEGLFAACLQKRETARQVYQPKSKENQKVPAKELAIIKEYLNNPDEFYFFKLTNDWLTIQRQHVSGMELLQKHLYLKKSGVRIGEVMGNELVPNHELALSIHLNKNAVLQIALDYEQAIQYLRRDNLDLAPVQKGWSLMEFENQALGWAKLLQNRVNNYFPKEMRILAPQPPKGGV
jgi:NOL1/NOP2/fmu family ribosome biogenesis protein